MADTITTMRQPSATWKGNFGWSGRGTEFVRFWNSEVTDDLNAVLERIYLELYGSREAEAGLLKHRRSSRKLHPTPPAPDDAAHRAEHATLPLQGRVKD